MWSAWPVPPCFPCTDDPWVVLATIRISADATKQNFTPQDMSISYADRRALYSTEALQVLVAAGILGGAV